MLVKDPNHRPYVNQILKKTNKYFDDSIIRRYRDQILHGLKKKTQTSEDLDFIYQVLIGAN